MNMVVNRFPLVERGSVYFEFESRAEMGIWSFSIQPSLSTTKPSISLSISAYAEQSAESTITVTTWTNVDHGLSSPLDGPVLIYARVLEGNLPVSGVEVRAEIRKPQGELIEIMLEDEGTGYPDVTMGDGIYTGYMTSFSSVSGFYSLVVRAEDGAGRARIPTQIVGQLDDCCGSNYPVVSSIPTPTFTRVVMGSSFYLTQGVQFFIRDGVPKIQDIFPPSRITDLRVHEYVQDSLEVVLSWSAPGEDYNTGAAARYSIRSSSDRDLLANGNFSLSGIPIHDSLIPKPELAGSQQFCTVTLPWGNEIFYYGIMAIDDGENTSPVSNLVSVFARELVIASEGSIGRNLTGSPGSLPSTVLEVFEDNLLVYIIAGCITGIVLIVLIVILISLRISRNKSNQKPKREFITEISSPTLIHSSSALTGILKDTSLSVLPSKSSPQDFSMDYAVYKSGLPGSPRDDVSWAILPTYTNSAFRKSSDTLVDSGYYRAGEPVDNVSEFYRPASDYVTYQNLKREEVTGDISDNGTGTTSSTDCENSETCSDKNLPNFQGLGKDTSRNAASEFHSLVVTGEDWRQGEGSKLSVSGPISLQGLSEYDLQEKRRRRESFV